MFCLCLVLEMLMIIILILLSLIRKRESKIIKTFQQRLWKDRYIGMNMKQKVRITAFDLTVCDSNFSILVEVFTNRILAENTYFTNNVEWTEQSITVLKPANKYQLIWQCHSLKSTLIDFPTSSNSLSSKCFVNIIFYGAKNNKLKRRDN